jgi:hypothetical protein
LQRLLSTGLVLGLLVATAAAFAITESLKLTQSPITRTEVDKVVSPGCGCDKGAATIKFWLRRPDTLTLTVVDSGRHEVKRLADGVLAHQRWNAFQWDGRTDSGSVAGDGTYFARVHLAKAHRTIQLPNPIELDTKAPKVLDAKPNRTVFSPDGDGQSDSVKIRYTLSEDAHAQLFLNGKQLVRTRFAQRKDTLTWYGRVNGAALPPGKYRLRLGAVDTAGNATAPKQRLVVAVRIRYVSLSRHAIRGIGAGTRFGVGVDTDAKTYAWRLDGKTGRSSAKALVVRAPAKPGRYRLVVTSNGHRDAATVVVVPR